MDIIEFIVDYASEHKKLHKAITAMVFKDLMAIHPEAVIRINRAKEVVERGYADAEYSEAKEMLDKVVPMIAHAHGLLTQTLAKMDGREVLVNKEGELVVMFGEDEVCI